MFKRYLIAGLLVWLPLGVTVLVIRLLVSFMDQLLVFIPLKYQPETLLGFNIPGLGVVMAVLIVLITGIIVANFFGRQLVAAWESLLGRIPLVRTIYHSVKQVAVTIFSSQGKSFRKVLLIEYPRKGIYTLAFQTGDAVEEVKQKSGKNLINVFVPTTPNPTSGFFIMVPDEDVQVLDLSIDEALKMIMSLGVIVPGGKGNPVIQEATQELSAALRGEKSDKDSK
ncbi:Uncharacterized membrane anchored protein Mext_4159 [hydrothermal vent metagenome]|uniref:Uncharacterized membrane anchored protein Mext_4159 n=1 Tax=hydrothermal vent metagenome TaxID=652676 RepID=A0A3B0ZGT9_9ZZZZ